MPAETAQLASSHPSPPIGQPVPASLRLTALSAVLFLLPLVLLGWTSWQSRAVVDDAYINFRIIDNVLAGDGPVYNVGERVEAGTSPAWLMVLTVAAAASGGAASLPWLSVWLGIAAGAAGLACAQVAALRIWEVYSPARSARVMVPAGAWVVASMSPFAELMACGLETGLTLLWIGAAALAVAGARAGRRWLWRAVLAGCGPMVRPELALLSVTLTGALAWTVAPAWMARFAVMGAAAALPAAVQVGRMGYYAVLVPNTALAKEAFSPFWSRGWTYALDAIGPYWLIVPLLPVLAMVTAVLRSSASSRTRVLVAAVAGGGLLQAVYVIRLGGDFMHARMLLAPVFAVVLPVAMWPWRAPGRPAPVWRLAYRAQLVLIVVWALASASFLRVPYTAQVDTTGIADEVNFYRRLSGRANPVTPDDYRAFGAHGVGRHLKARADRSQRLLLLDEQVWTLGPQWPATIVTDGIMVGLAGFMAGPQVHIADSLGLTDPIASRLRLEVRGRTGHEKWRPRDWMVARFADAGDLRQILEAYPQAADARRALSCGLLADALAAVTEQMSLRRFLRNVALAPSLTRLRFSADPYKASRELCDNP